MWTHVKQQILGWAGLIRIDNAFTYKWLGDPASPGGLNRSVLTNIQITPTRTIMNMTAGPIDLTVTFLSPIEVCCIPISCPLDSLTSTKADGPREAILRILVLIPGGYVQRLPRPYGAGVLGH